CRRSDELLGRLGWVGGQGGGQLLEGLEAANGGEVEHAAGYAVLPAAQLSAGLGGQGAADPSGKADAVAVGGQLAGEHEFAVGPDNGEGGIVGRPARSAPGGRPSLSPALLCGALAGCGPPPRPAVGSLLGRG